MSQTPPREELNTVSFTSCETENGENRKRHLTAKYDRKQRQVINRRIKLEDYVYESIRKLYNCKEEDDDPDCDVDLDELVGLGSDEERKLHIIKLFVKCPSSETSIQAFVDELLKRLPYL